jgi:hypothetical protein
MPRAGGIYAEKVVSAHSAGLLATAGATVATIREIDKKPLALFDELRARLHVTTAAIGSTPTLDVYLQRAVAADPDPTDDSHWEDFYHFAQVTTATVDKIVSLPLPLAQDVDASLGSMSRTRGVVALAADTALGGHWMGPIRIREVVTTSGTITTAAVYDIEFVGR